MEEASNNNSFTDVTEMSGAMVTKEQIDRLHHRYKWAGVYCKSKDVLELACGNAQGAGYLSNIANTYVASDYSRDILLQAKEYYQNRINLFRMDAQYITFANASFDVILIFEAIYYLNDIEMFISECRRVLRTKGYLLIVTANKDLYDFNPSPYSNEYYGVLELEMKLTKAGFTTEYYGVSPISNISLKQKIFRPIKAVASRLGLIPKTMKGKQWLKRLVFGKLVMLPNEISLDEYDYIPPRVISDDKPDDTHKVIYCAAHI